MHAIIHDHAWNPKTTLLEMEIGSAVRRFGIATLQFYHKKYMNTERGNV